MIESEYFESAALEFDGPSRLGGLSIKALAECDGDMEKARFFYIRERAKQLHAEAISGDYESTDQERPVGGSVLRNTLWDWFVYCLTHKYANFDGRATRREFWGFFLFAFLALFAVSLISGGSDFFIGFVMLAFATPYFSVVARRLHDLGYSGWLSIGLFFPVLNFGVLIACALAGKEEPNRYGPPIP